MNVPSFMFAGKCSLTYFVLTCFFTVFLGSSTFAQSGPSYYLIAGSFNNLESAQNGLAKIQSDYGRRPELLFPDTQAGSRRYRVSVYRSSTRREVDAFANSLKQKGMKAGWILEMQKPAYPSPVMRGSVATQRLASDSYAKNGIETYYLITGSFQSFDQADRDRLEKIEKGFESEILFPEETGSDSYKVSVFYSTSRKQIDSYAALLKRKGIKGWIYTAEPTGAIASTSRGASNAKVVKTETAAPNPDDANKTFHIVGGSFKDFDQASTFSETMKLKGLSPNIIFPSSDQGYFRVSVYTNKNRAAVSAKNAQLKKAGTLSKGWIFAE